jgi:tellurite resistance protein
MLYEFMSGEMQKKRNNKLMQTFRSKVKKLEAETNKVNSELQEYEKMLGWHYSGRNGKISASGLYMTH